MQLEGSLGYEKIKSYHDVFNLLWLIQSICCWHDQNADKTYAMEQSIKGLFYFYQKLDTSNAEYLKEYKAQVESLDDFESCTLGKFPCLVKKKLSKLYNKTIDEAIEDEIKMSKEGVKKEVILISGADKLRYGGLKSTLDQHLSMGMNQYPCTVNKTLNILNTYHTTTKGN